LEGKEGRQLAGVALGSGTKGAPPLPGKRALDRKEEKSQPPASLLFSSPSMFFLPSLF